MLKNEVHIMECGRSLGCAEARNCGTILTRMGSHGSVLARDHARKV